MNSAGFDENSDGLCLCCEEHAATDRDTDVGPVCAECKGYLAVVNARLITTPGICHSTEEAAN